MARLLADRGAAVFNADELVRELYRPGKRAPSRAEPLRTRRAGRVGQRRPRPRRRDRLPRHGPAPGARGPPAPARARGAGAAIRSGRLGGGEGGGLRGDPPFRSGNRGQIRWVLLVVAPAEERIRRWIERGGTMDDARRRIAAQMFPQRPRGAPTTSSSTTDQQKHCAGKVGNVGRAGSPLREPEATISRRLFSCRPESSKTPSPPLFPFATETRSCSSERSRDFCLFGSRPGRRRWAMAGPFFPGSSVYGAAFDARTGARPLGLLEHALGRGAFVERRFRQDLEASRSAPGALPRDTGAALKHVWQIAPARPRSPTCFTAGVEPAALFESRDGGQNVVAQPAASGVIPIVRDWHAGRRRACAPTHRSWSIASARAHHRGRSRPPASQRRRRTVVANGAQGACAPSSCPTSTRSSASASTRSCGTRRVRTGIYLQNHWGLYRIRRRGGVVEGRGQRRAVRLRLRHGDPSPRSRHRVHRAARVGRVPLHARRPPARSTARATPASRGSR